MAAVLGQMKCTIFPSVFSGELVLRVNTVDDDVYEGVAPKDYVKSRYTPNPEGVDGYVRVWIIEYINSEYAVRVRMPDEEVIKVTSNRVVEQKSDKLPEATIAHDFVQTMFIVPIIHGDFDKLRLNVGVARQAHGWDDGLIIANITEEIENLSTTLFFGHRAEAIRRLVSFVIGPMSKPESNVGLPLLGFTTRGNNGGQES